VKVLRPRAIEEQPTCKGPSPARSSFSFSLAFSPSSPDARAQWTIPRLERRRARVGLSAREQAGPEGAGRAASVRAAPAQVLPAAQVSAAAEVPAAAPALRAAQVLVAVPSTVERPMPETMRARSGVPARTIPTS